MKKIVATVLAGALLTGALAQGEENGGLSDGQRAYVAAIAAEREAADLKMRDEYWSPLAVTDMVLLKTEPVSIRELPSGVRKFELIDRLAIGSAW